MATPVNRPKRSKLSQRDKLTFKGHRDPNFAYRVINDKDSRIKDALESGWEFVCSDDQLGDKRAAEAGPIDTRVSKSVGGGTTGFLMRIPKEYYEEDQKEKAAKIDEIEKALKPNKNQGQYGSGLTNE